MLQTITVDQALTQKGILFVDMRSPSEFEDGCIPGAINIPIFSDEERADIGILYKQEGVEVAKQRGLEIASSKLPTFVQQFREMAAESKLIVYCWRGGMRSRSIATVLTLMGVPVYQLTGGYKQYRAYVLARLNGMRIKPKLAVIHGFTGVGKTTLLQELSDKGLPVIDLEGLANHRGSAFGHVGRGKGVSAKNFDALLLAQLDMFHEAPYIIVESESKRIGNVYLPDCFMEAMRNGLRILVTASMGTRVQRLLDEYLNAVQEEQTGQILNSVLTLRNRLGNKKTDHLVEFLQKGSYHEFVEVLLQEYYDPLYNYGKDPSQFNLIVSAENLTEAANHIIDFLDKEGNVT